MNCNVRKNSYLYHMKDSKKKQQQIDPTKSELEILQILWNHGPSTVRFVNDKLNEDIRQVQYTSTLKLMQIMLEKGLLSRDESQMKHIYNAIEHPDKTKAKLLNDFINTIYNGSASSLMMQLWGNKNTSPEELEEIKKFIKKFDKDAK